MSGPEQAAVGTAAPAPDAAAAASADAPTNGDATAQANGQAQTQATPDLSAILGQAAWVMMQSPAHRHLFVGDLDWLSTLR